MQIPQLIYGSTDRGSIRGYGVLGRSSGIDERMVKEFCRWAPSHGALQSDEADVSSLNFFPVGGDHFIISRTVYGGPEYSGRGGRQVVTIALLMNHHQLSQYQNNPLQVAHTAIALGHLICPPLVRSTLQPVALPRSPIHADLLSVTVTEQTAANELLQCFDAGRKSIVIGATRPNILLNYLFDSGRDYELSQQSFSTGLKPSASRDFGIQFLSSADHITIRQFESHGRVCVKIPPSVPSCR